MTAMPSNGSRPVNKTAARVVSAGTHYEPANADRADEWDDNPPKTSAVPKNAPDITGERRDRVVIVGYLMSGTNGSKWIGRCDCGRFVTRNGKTWRKNHGPNMCQDCAHVEFLKRRSSTYTPKVNAASELRRAIRHDPK